ncbi:hypothetical protein AAG570_011518 [Ranatra chinensis]|uniref:DNA polymerase zeta catalytic subunit n=1 Tax=Ranatra chinensis TaxID=642074 RepID=A0ABD0YX32_9HEMI
MLSLRIVNVDYYLTPPLRGLDVTYSHFRGAPVKQVPVIRVFGITDSGFKGCIHVHGVLPYIYIPFDWKENPDSVMYEIAYGLDKAINENAGNYDKQHVFKIVLVTGVPFYGYHSKERQFLKIYFYNPATIKKSIQLLQNAKICNKKIQPYEAHIPFILQFFIDYNLYGMNFIHLTEWVPRSLNYEDGKYIHCYIIWVLSDIEDPQ